MARNQIATAYVQVMPSMDGVAPKVRSTFSDAGTSSGSAFGSNLVSTIKGLIATAGIGEALKKTLTEGAALEQSLGGIETLFKDSAATVIANAQQAYKTAGISANAYMEQVTSFSASLLQSLGGDTAKAAEVANMALTDMSDNANKMGTEMERITDAYQGFAKQNYTMLDNLKLGYGGTKTEMERLLKDAQKLSGVKYDINNLSDVYEAIHVIQEEMSILGTTADEASTTLTGSFNSVKAAFTDFLGNLALGKAMGPSLNALAETTLTFLTGNLAPAIWNIVSALPGSMVTLINGLLPDNMESVVSTMVTSFSEFVTTSLPTILASGVAIITETTSGFLSGIPQFMVTAGSLLTQLLAAFVAALPSMLQSGINLVLNLASGLITAIPDVISAAANVIADLLSELASHLPELLQQGIELICEMAAGLIKAIPDAVSAAGEVVVNVIRAFLETDWGQVGRDILSGIAAGIRNGASAIINAAKEAAQAALAAAKSALGIASPSKRFKNEVGKQAMEGWALGIQENANLIYNAVADTGNHALSEGLRISNNKINSSNFGTSAVAGKTVSVIQNIYSEAKTAADLMEEARYQQERAVIFGV